MRLAKNLCAAALLLSVGQAAMAQEPVFTLSQGIYSYTMSTATTTPNGADAITVKTNTLATMPNSLAIAAVVDRMVYYISPATPGFPLAAGYMVLRNLEAGALVKLGSMNVDKPKSESSDKVIGAFATYYLPLGTNLLELTFSPSYVMQSSKSTMVNPATGAAAEVKTNTTGLSTQLSATVSVPLSKNVTYAGGLAVTMNSMTESESKTKVSSTDIALNLASLRYSW